MMASKIEEEQEEQEEEQDEQEDQEQGAYFKTKDEEKRFLEWFWKGRNGNDLVKKINACAQTNKLEDRIRREKESPAIYAVVLNDDSFPFEENGEQWRLCRIGFTHRSIKRGISYRMEQVEKEIEKGYYNTKKKEKDRKTTDAKVSTLFVLRIGAVDTTSYYETEKRIREKVGKPVRKDKVKELNLPFPTEWVLTTQKHIDQIKGKIKERAGRQADAVDLDIFKEVKTTPTPPDEYQEWLKIEAKVKPIPKSSSSAKKEESKYPDGKSSGNDEKECRRKAKSTTPTPRGEKCQEGLIKEGKVKPIPKSSSSAKRKEENKYPDGKSSGNVEKESRRKAKSSSSSSSCLAATFSSQTVNVEPQDRD